MKQFLYIVDNFAYRLLQLVKLIEILSIGET
jgi:hypothetical protein